MAFIARRLVSKQKRRFQQDGYDLDLTYITDNIIAMGYPAADTVQGLYRNPLPAVASLLHARHPGKYKVYNLCVEDESGYSATLMQGPVTRLPLYDHQPAPLDLVHEFCIDATAWLSSSSSHVVAVHCKAGKGRTGIMVCALLVYLASRSPELLPPALQQVQQQDLLPAHSSSAQAMLWHYDTTRTHDGRGLTIPSQRRCVQQFSEMLFCGAGGDKQLVKERARPIYLHKVVIKGLPLWLMRSFTVGVWERPPGCYGHRLTALANGGKHSPALTTLPLPAHGMRSVVASPAEAALAADKRTMSFLQPGSSWLKSCMSSKHRLGLTTVGSGVIQSFTACVLEPQQRSIEVELVTAASGALPSCSPSPRVPDTVSAFPPSDATVAVSACVSPVSGRVLAPSPFTEVAAAAAVAAAVAAKPVHAAQPSITLLPAPLDPSFSDGTPLPVTPRAFQQQQRPAQIGLMQVDSVDIPSYIPSSPSAKLAVENGSAVFSDPGEAAAHSFTALVPVAKERPAIELELVQKPSTFLTSQDRSCSTPVASSSSSPRDVAAASSLCVTHDSGAVQAAALQSSPGDPLLDSTPHDHLLATMDQRNTANDGMSEWEARWGTLPAPRQPAATEISVCSEIGTVCLTFPSTSYIRCDGACAHASHACGLLLEGDVKLQLFQGNLGADDVIDKHGSPSQFWAWVSTAFLPRSGQHEDKTPLGHAGNFTAVAEIEKQPLRAGARSAGPPRQPRTKVLHLVQQELDKFASSLKGAAVALELHYHG